MSGRSILWYKANGAVRAALARNGGLLPGQVVVTEYPKCGGTWLCQMLEALTGVPYPRLRIPRPGPNLLHGHYLEPRGIRGAVVLWRDPRDVLVSHFFHCLHYRDMTSARNTDRVRALIGLSREDEIDFAVHFPAYYDLVSERRIHPYFTIADFHDRWFAREGCFHTSYERLQHDPVEELLAAMSFLGFARPPLERARQVVSEFEFSRVSGRRKGEEAAADYLRKGIVGDWVNHLGGDALDRVTNDLAPEIRRYEGSRLCNASAGAGIEP